ncbi:MAG TPA: N-formylglutamate amidohydrolase [Longimicrobiales bacterium]|nr:N-formylglutamate amidohydrolase [Longimicrobiales bacterium]
MNLSDAESRPALVLSCEHAGNRVPGPWRPLFEGADEVLASHRGWDPGALALARRMARTLDAPLIAVSVTRLLVDANRSPGHPRLFSPFTRGLPPGERERLLARHYRPHHARVEAAVRDGLGRTGRVLHVGVHSFTPVLNGRLRRLDVGLLYDPSRELERSLAAAWLAAARGALPELRFRANAPYRGTSDGLTTLLRRRFPPERYSGVELEIGQGLLEAGARVPGEVARGLEASLRELVAAPPERATP